MIRRLEEKDIKQVAKIHKQELTGFLPELGEKFLEKFYQQSLHLPEMFTFVKIYNGRVLGFVTGITTAKGLYRKIILKDILGFGLLLIDYFFTHPSKIIKITQTISYPGFSQDYAELLTIAIDQQFQRKGIGRKLFNKIVQEFSERKINKFKISVYNRLTANKFYLKVGCKLDSSFIFLGEKMNYWIYHRT